MKIIIITSCLIAIMGCSDPIVGPEKTNPKSTRIDMDTIIVREITADIDTAKGD